MNSEIPSNSQENINEKPDDSREYKPYLGSGMTAFYRDGEWIVDSNDDALHKELFEEIGYSVEKGLDLTQSACNKGLTSVYYTERGDKPWVAIEIPEDKEAELRRIIEELLVLGVIGLETEVRLEIIKKTGGLPMGKKFPAFEMIRDENRKNENVKIISPEEFRERNEKK